MREPDRQRVQREEWARPQEIASVPTFGSVRSEPQGGRRRRRPLLFSGHGRNRQARNVQLGGRRAAEDVVPARRLDSRGTARVLRGAVRHGGGRLAVLRPARSGRHRPLGATDTRQLRLSCEGARVDDRHEPADQERAFAAFREAVAPLELSGKLRAVLLQYHPRFVKSAAAKEELSRVRALLEPLVPLIEFRHRSWLEPWEQTDTLSFLQQQGLSYVSVDAPATRASNVVPRVAAGTNPLAYIPLPRAQLEDLECPVERPRRGREQLRTRDPRDVQVPGRVDRYATRIVVRDAAEEGGPDELGAGRIELLNENVAASSVEIRRGLASARVERPLRPRRPMARAVRTRRSCHVRASVRSYCDFFLTHVIERVGRVDEGWARNTFANLLSITSTSSPISG